MTVFTLIQKLIGIILIAIWNAVLFLGAFCLCNWLVTSSFAQRKEETMSNPRYEIAYATYLGGSAWDQAREVIPYPDGSVLVGAQTSSDDIPTTKDVVQPRYRMKPLHFVPSW